MVTCHQAPCLPSIIVFSIDCNKINYKLFSIHYNIKKTVEYITGTVEHSREGRRNYSCVAATARSRRDTQRAACRRRAYSQLS